jgi:hypothetical protein
MNLLFVTKTENGNNNNNQVQESIQRMKCNQIIMEENVNIMFDS